MRTTSRLGALLGIAVLTFGVTSVALAGSAGFAGGPKAVAAAPDVRFCGVEPLDIELIIDTSGSMGSNSRLTNAKAAADNLIDSLDGNGGVGASGIHRVGLTRFSGTTASVVLALGGSDAATVKGAINGLTSSGNTPLKTGMAAGAGDLNANARNAVGGAVARVMILLTDGAPNPDDSAHWGTYGNGSSQRPTSANAASYLAQADIAYSIALGSGGGVGSQGVDLGLMQLLDKSDGHYYNVVNSADLAGLFADIYTQIACPAANITASKAVDQDVAAPGDKLEYTIHLANDGGQDGSVDVHDDISALLAHGSFDACDNGCTNDSDSVDWAGVSVPMGGSVDLHYSIDLNADGWDVGQTDLPNTVVVDGTNCAADSVDDSCSTLTSVSIQASEPPTQAPSDEASPSFFATVEAATDIPTEPNTATVGGHGTSGPSDGSWLLVAALGVLLASVVVMTPARARNRR